MSRFPMRQQPGPVGLVLRSLAATVALLLVAGVFALSCCTDSAHPTTVAAPAPVASTDAQASAHDQAVVASVEIGPADDDCDVHPGTTDASPASPSRSFGPASKAATAEPAARGVPLVTAAAIRQRGDRAGPGPSPHQLCVMRT